MADVNYGKGTISRGVKYAKISKLDQNGIDRSAYLEQLQSFRLTYSDIGTVQYNISSVQEQTNHYLFVCF
jgi:hypothetical protein